MKFYLILLASLLGISKSASIEDLTNPNVISTLTPNRTITDAFFVNDEIIPKFQIFDERFKAILGDNPSIYSIAKNDGIQFAHEAPVLRDDKVYFCSNAGTGGSDINTNNRILTFNMNDIRDISSNVNITINYEIPSNDIQMTNGMAPYLDGKLIVSTEGRGETYGSGLFMYDPKNNKTTPILTSYFGRPFNSLNDLTMYPSGDNGIILFTDSLYGYLQDFRPYPGLPEQIYSYNLNNGKLKAVADNFMHPNGIALSADNKVAYITDSGAQNGTVNTHLPATIYSFNIVNDDGVLSFENRKLFAHVHTGVPDGIKVDTNGNVYASTGDGVNTYNSKGELIGVINVGTTSANLALLGNGQMVLLAENTIYIVNLNKNVEPTPFHYA